MGSTSKTKVLAGGEECLVWLVKKENEKILMKILNQFSYSGWDYSLLYYLQIEGMYKMPAYCLERDLDK